MVLCREQLHSCTIRYRKESGLLIDLLIGRNIWKMLCQNRDPMQNTRATSPWSTNIIHNRLTLATSLMSTSSAYTDKPRASAYLLGSSGEADAGVRGIVDGVVVLQELLANDRVHTLCLRISQLLRVLKWYILEHSRT